MGGWDDKLNEEEVTKFVIIIDPHEDGLSIVECPSIPGCIGRGTTDKKS
jgi:predicted RNase H-like HicB family nuclease